MLKESFSPLAAFVLIVLIPFKSIADSTGLVTPVTSATRVAVSNASQPITLTVTGKAPRYSGPNSEYSDWEAYLDLNVFGLGLQYLDQFSVSQMSGYTFNGGYIYANGGIHTFSFQVTPAVTSASGQLRGYVSVGMIFSQPLPDQPIGGILTFTPVFPVAFYNVPHQQENNILHLEFNKPLKHRFMIRTRTDTMGGSRG